MHRRRVKYLRRTISDFLTPNHPESQKPDELRGKHCAAHALTAPTDYHKTDEIKNYCRALINCIVQNREDDAMLCRHPFIIIQLFRPGGHAVCLHRFTMAAGIEELSLSLMNSGWIKLHRQLLEHEMWLKEPFTWSQAWIDLLLLANHEANSFWVRGIEIEVRRGQVGWSQLSLAKRWQWSRGKVQRFLNVLEKKHQIVQQTTRISSLIEVINYNRYQMNSTTDDTTDSTTNGQQTVQQTSTNKKDKNVKNEKNITYSVRQETLTLYETTKSACEKHGIVCNINTRSLDVIVDRYLGKIRMGVEIQHCISWLIDKNLRMINTQRIGNWFKRALEKQKKDQLKQLEWKESKNNPAFAQRLKKAEMNQSIQHFTQSL